MQTLLTFQHMVVLNGVMIVYFYRFINCSSIDPLECSGNPAPGVECWEKNITRLHHAEDISTRLDYKIEYNKLIAPSDAEGGDSNNVTVWTAMYIESMSSFKAATMDYEMDMYLAVAWYDHRLKHKNADPILINDLEFSKKVWVPDLYFVNSKSSHFQEVTSPNFMILIYPDGLVFRSARYDVTFSCMMDLASFPMDEQLCPIVIQCYAYVKQMVKLEWFEKDGQEGGFPISHNENIRLNDMVITGKGTYKCQEYPYPMFRGQGYWDCLLGKIRMKRMIGFHVFQTYIPSAMLVCISWLSFWLDPRAAPARISLTITTLLTLVSVSNGARQGLPQVSYIKAIDVWLSVATAFVFCTLLEYTIVSYVISKKKTNCRKHSDRVSFNCHNDQSLANGAKAVKPKEEWLLLNSWEKSRLNRNGKYIAQTTRICGTCNLWNERRAKRVDQISRVLFPTFFMLFCGCYWTHYLIEYYTDKPME